MWDEINKIESVLVRVPHEDAREALRALDAIQRALDEVHDAARPRIGAWLPPLHTAKVAPAGGAAARQFREGNVPPTGITPV